MNGQGMGQGQGGMNGQGMGQAQGAAAGMGQAAPTGYGGAFGAQHAMGGMGQAPGGMGQPGMPYGHVQPAPGAPYWPGYGYAVPSGHAPGMGYGQGPVMGQGHGMAEVMQEIASGGNGLSSLTKLLDFDDKEFWKGALVGAAAVLLLTNESVQNVLFRGAVKGRDAVKEGVEKVKESVDKLKEQARTVKEKGDE
jgi:hypothetical protein